MKRAEIRARSRAGIRQLTYRTAVSKLDCMSVLPSEIKNLSVDEKCELLDALWQDIEAQRPALSDEQVAELDRRMAHYEQEPSAVIPGSR